MSEFRVDERVLLYRDVCISSARTDVEIAKRARDRQQSLIDEMALNPDSVDGLLWERECLADYDRYVASRKATLARLEAVPLHHFVR